MPKICSYECDSCDIRMPSGWGLNLYAKDAEGKGIRCLYPEENVTAEKFKRKTLDDAVKYKD